LENRKPGEKFLGHKFQIIGGKKKGEKFLGKIPGFLGFLTPFFKNSIIIRGKKRNFIILGAYKGGICEDRAL